MKALLFFLIIALNIQISNAQNVAINTDGSAPHATAMLDVSSTSKGMLTPRMTASQRSAISSAATGLLVFQTDGSAGYYYYDGSNWLQISTSATVTTPAGIISQFAGASAPDGYLLCQGQAVSRTTYAALFQVIGTTYGAGNGSTTFNLPDLRTRVPVGLSSSGTFSALNNKGGAETHTITIAQMPAHDHTFSSPAHTHDVDPAPFTITGGNHRHSIANYQGGGVTSSGPDRVLYNNDGPLGGVRYTDYESSHSHTVDVPNTTSTGTAVTGTIGSRGGGGSIPLLQPYIVLNYIIKY